MKWFRLLVAAALLAAVGAFLWLQFSPEIAIAYALGLAAAVAAFSIVMDDSHATWLARTRNVPVWGLWVMVPVMLFLIVPPLWQVAGAVWAVIGQTLSWQVCLPPVLSLVTVICLAILARRRPRRRRPDDNET